MGLKSLIVNAFCDQVVTNLTVEFCTEGKEISFEFSLDIAGVKEYIDSTKPKLNSKQRMK